ncbi:rhodanese-like domain-containing protein [Pseudomonas sp.]|uniref:rhodanese-like domain-containing protein n=1 Tax=Pseudomonas sp. TaxID=306 RepID=UPI002BBD8129|nr:rhodanese-like domain-containing protein [Pseudomonas sp.]HUE93723.1 rhodanese-like domain-containing protein [Pseudomonas sp.]
MNRITISELAQWQAAGHIFSLVDVRRASVRLADAAQISGAQWRDPDALFTWKDEIPRDRPAIFYCAHGHEISQGCAETLAAMGLDARYLIDGFAGWRAADQTIESLAD